MYNQISLLLSLVLFATVKCYEVNEINNYDLYEIEGKVFPQEGLHPNPNWVVDTKVMIKGGHHMGFLREDGNFVIQNVPSGSYVVEVLSPNFSYEPVRVEINSKGKLRARKVNYIQTSQVVPVPYPLKLQPLGPTRYFYTREQWRATDFLFNPMVLMMVLPLLLIMVLPRMMDDPETKKEMDQLTSYELPEMSELIASLFSEPDKQKGKAVKSAKKPKQIAS